MSFVHGFIEIYDSFQADDPVTYKKATALEFCWDGYPSEAAGSILEDLVKHAHQYYQNTIIPNHWASRDVAALMVKWTGEVVAEVDGLGSVVQSFELTPSSEINPIHETLWRIFIGPKPGAYDIRCYRLNHDEQYRVMRALVEVQWRDWQKNQPLEALPCPICSKNLRM